MELLKRVIGKPYPPELNGRVWIHVRIIISTAVTHHCCMVSFDASIHLFVPHGWFFEGQLRLIDVYHTMGRIAKDQYA